MDELSEDDKLTVARARKVQRFMSQPFTVAEVFTGTPGVFVSLEDTIKGFQEILSGTHDDLPEGAFYMASTVSMVVTTIGENAPESSRPCWSKLSYEFGKFACLEDALCYVPV